MSKGQQAYKSKELHLTQTGTHTLLSTNCTSKYITAEKLV